MSRAIAFAGAAAALVAAFALGTRFSGVTERVVIERGEDRTTAAPTVTVTRSEGSATLTADQVRAIVRDELAAAREPGEATIGPDPQVVAAREQSALRAHELVTRAIDRGTWSEQDREDLLAVMKDLERAQADDVLSELFPALNDGRVKLTYSGTPL